MKKLSYRIEHDETPMDPREWDNLGTMHCWHSRYNLGDEQHNDDADMFIAELGNFEEDYEWTEKQYRIHKEAARKRAFKENIILPLYLYDHSGLTISTGSFSCPWDSGQVGWIIVPIEQVKKEYGWKVLTKKRREQIEGYLRNEVETYDQYLTGDVWGYVIQDEDGNSDDYDSCWGFFGKDNCIEAAEEALKATIEYQKTLRKKEFEDARDNLISINTGFVHV